MTKRLPLRLQPEDRAELESWTRSHTMEQRYARRAKVILLLAEGRTYDAVQAQTGLGRPAVSKWKKRFLAHGIAGLQDRPRSGKPPVYTLADEARVTALACSKPEGGYTSWSQRRIAEQTGMSQSKVCSILGKNALRPHKTDYWCGKSRGPEFEPKMLTIVGLYLDPPANALVLSVDEKTQMQALDRTQPELPMRQGQPKRQTTTYKRHGVVSLIAALAVHQGEVTAKTMEKNTAANFLSFLKQIDRKYRHKHLHIIVDNLSVHKQKDVREWLGKKRKITLHFTPTYSSWLNQVEIWFGLLSKDVLKGGVWHSKEQLIKQLLAYIDTYNKTRAKPFSWKYDGQPKKSKLIKKS